MKAIRKINNNVAVCLDAGGSELIAFGKGISFPKMPYEIEDLGSVDRTFYDLDPSQVALISEIPEDIFRLSFQICDRGSRVLHCAVSDSFPLAMADHLSFALKRTREGIIIRNPMKHDIPHLHPEEYKIGTWAVRLLSREYGLMFPPDEACNIALHFINMETMSGRQDREEGFRKTLDIITEAVENGMGCILDRDSFSYSRFASHIRYMLERNSRNQPISSDNRRLYETLKKEYPSVYQCVQSISTLFGQQMDWVPDEEELLYLMIHINRLISREGL